MIGTKKGGRSEHHPRRLVASQTKLPLQEKRRDAALIRSHQVSRPEPNRQRRFRVMQKCPGRKGDLIPTTGALLAPQSHEFVSAPVPASRADEAFRPAALSQILLASLLGSEHRLEFTQGLWKRWARHGHILLLGAC